MPLASRLLGPVITILLMAASRAISFEALVALLVTWGLRAVVIAPIALCLGALWASGLCEARARVSRARTRRPDARGRRTLHGVARALGRASEGALVTQTTRERIVRGRRGRDWVPVASQVTGAPFELTLPSGEVVEVDALAFALEGFARTSTQSLPGSPFEAPEREAKATVQPGDEVWVTGVLRGPEAPGGGAYRGGRGARLRAPTGQPVVIAKRPPWERWAALARAHRSGALFGLLAAVAEALAGGRNGATLTRALGLDGEGPSSGGALLLAVGAVGLSLAARFYAKRLAQVEP